VNTSLSGLAQYFKLRKELYTKELVQKNLESKMKNKQNMVGGMRLESLDLDLLDEQSRKDLGYAGKQEIVIYDEEQGKIKQNK